MSTLKKCPECGETFSDEEFCLIDGARLRRQNADPLQPEQADSVMAQSTASAETSESRGSGGGRSWASRLTGLFGHDIPRPTGSTSRAGGPELPPELSGWVASRPLRGKKSGRMGARYTLKTGRATRPCTNATRPGV